jgi:hypothetical protein
LEGANHLGSGNGHRGNGQLRRLLLQGVVLAGGATGIADRDFGADGWSQELPITGRGSAGIGQDRSHGTTGEKQGQRAQGEGSTHNKRNPPQLGSNHKEISGSKALDSISKLEGIEMRIRDQSS